MEDTPKYKVSYVAAPPTPPTATRPALISYSLTYCVPGTQDKTQERYYKADKVEAIIASDEAIIGCHEREIAALRRYIDVFHQELLAHPELPESIQKVVYAHRQTLIIAKDQAEGKECNACAGLGCANCHGGASGKEAAHA